MVMIANYQYGWDILCPDIQKKFGWDRARSNWHLRFLHFPKTGCAI